MESLNIATEVFNIEIIELDKVKAKLDDNFNKIVDLILESNGRVVLTGIGKSGIIAKKIAASLASTGTNTFFMHSAEALHGDLGMVYKDDIVIAISNSGSSQEILEILPSIKKIGATLIAMTGNIESKLATEAKFVLDIGIENEACPLHLAPTSSTTATLVMGDALTVALIKKRNFKPEGFALYHPGGALGRRLLTRIKDIMHKDIPNVNINSDISDIVFEIIEKKLTMTLVHDGNNTVGIITDGDIRRLVFNDLNNIQNINAGKIMTRDFKMIDKDELASTALEKMREQKISCLVVTECEIPIGIITIHDVFDFN